MDKLSFTSPYRTAAILAAFSRASDEPPRVVVAPKALVAEPRLRDVAARALARAARHGVAGVSRLGRSWALLVVRQTVPHPPVLDDDTAFGRGEPPPALASHFDLCHSTGIELQPRAWERAA